MACVFEKAGVSTEDKCLEGERIHDTLNGRRGSSAAAAWTMGTCFAERIAGSVDAVRWCGRTSTAIDRSRNLKIVVGYVLNEAQASGCGARGTDGNERANVRGLRALTEGGVLARPGKPAIWLGMGALKFKPSLKVIHTAWSAGQDA